MPRRRNEQAKRSRASRFAVSIDPRWLERVENSRGAWYETSEEIESGLAWGHKKAALLRWVRRQMGRRLTRRERRCIELYYFRGKTFREAGSITKTNASSVHRAVARGVRKLRMAAQEECPLKSLNQKRRSGSHGTKKSQR